MWYFTILPLQILLRTCFLLRKDLSVWMQGLYMCIYIYIYIYIYTYLSLCTCIIYIYIYIYMFDPPFSLPLAQDLRATSSVQRIRYTGRHCSYRHWIRAWCERGFLASGERGFAEYVLFFPPGEAQTDDTRGFSQRPENSESAFCSGLQRATRQPQHTTRKHPFIIIMIIIMVIIIFTEYALLRPAGVWRKGGLGTVGFHNFNLRIFNLRVSNPNKLIVDVFLTRCRISMCQGLGPKKHD